MKSKNIFICVLKMNKSYGIGTTWGWVITDWIYIFGWTNPLRTIFSFTCNRFSTLFTYNRVSTTICFEHVTRFHISTFRPELRGLLTTSAAWSSYPWNMQHTKRRSPPRMSNISFSVGILDCFWTLCQVSEAEFLRGFFKTLFTYNRVSTTICFQQNTFSHFNI